MPAVSGDNDPTKGLLKSLDFIQTTVECFLDEKNTNRVYEFIREHEEELSEATKEAIEAAVEAWAFYRKALHEISNPPPRG